MKTKLNESSFKNTNQKKNDKERANSAKKSDHYQDHSILSQRSYNEINELEKKGILSWDSENSEGSSERLHETRKTFLNELNILENTGEKKKKN